MGEPRVFTIPPGAPFLPTFVVALLDGTLTDGWPDGAELADATIYLPTRRAGRALAALLADGAEARAALLPRIVPLGEAEGESLDPSEGPTSLPPIPPLERRLLLAQLVQRWAAKVSEEADPDLAPGVPFVVPASPAHALALAADLEALMDAFAIEGVSWGDVGGLVDGEHSRYFDRTLRFLRIAHEEWPGILRERGASDPALRRHLDLLSEAERLGAAPPDAPVIAAGSTGSMPATAALLGAISRLPRGAVVLPGLDTGMDETAWAALAGEGPGADGGPIWGHPQYMLRRLLTDSLRIGRGDVRVLGPTLPPHHPAVERRRLVSEMMRPAGSTERWADLLPLEHECLVKGGCEGLAVLEAADEREEALAIAVALRETLATPGATAALVTPDRSLAKRVAAELRRWGVVAEDSAGTSLRDSPAGRLAWLAAQAAADDFSPVPLLALLAHPHLTLGRGREEIERATAALEIGVLRGPAPRPGIEGLLAALALRREQRGWRDPVPVQNLTERDWNSAAKLLRRLGRAFSGFAPERGASLDLLRLSRAHAAAVTALAAPPARGPAPACPGLGAVQDLFDELAAADRGGSLLGRFADYPAFFAELAGTRTLPPEQAGVHSRVKILGLLEARLLEADRVVLGALDESIWPPAAQTDSFLNRPMRAGLGLSAPERRIGQTAHDFTQALGTHDILLTRARKRGGQPTVPSRFLERLRAFAGRPAWEELARGGARFARLAAILDAPRQTPRLKRPAPRPGPARFPRSLSVTEVETLVRDPYAVYARHVLKLTPLDDIAALPTVAERGTILHQVLADFAASVDGPLPPGAEADLLRRGLEAFETVRDAYPELYALWAPDFRRLAPHYLAWERGRRRSLTKLMVEAAGQLEIPIWDRDTFRLRGRADRIELHGGSTAAIVDFKSGRVPSPKEIGVGFSPQLTLEAAMLQAGGFKGVAPSRDLPALIYVKLGGRDRLCHEEVSPPKGDTRSMSELVTDHRQGLESLVRRYAVEGAGYLSRPYAQYALRYSAYDHLARVKEWSATAGADPDAP